MSDAHRGLSREDRILHLLSPIEPQSKTWTLEELPDDAVLADCGCYCHASERTQKLLKQPGNHLIYCLPCFMKEHD